MDRHSAIDALQWHIDVGADEALSVTPVDATAMPEKKEFLSEEAPVAILGASDAHKESLRLAKQAQTLEALQQAIAGFEGLPLKKTATKLVFSDGNPQAHIMLVGDVPDAEEDRFGKPFAGTGGQLLDIIFSYIGLGRHNEDPAKAVYMANILNWRPPGSRSPLASEIEVSLPFIEKHIALVRPQMLVLAGGVATKALLGESASISKLRGKFYEYRPVTAGLFDTPPVVIPALAIYNPAHLLNTPSQKRQVWQDMLQLVQKRRAHLIQQ
ncbi:MAG: uracil-DNA glycosylase [Alphaproteobacteria bacterium CG_4_9_14_3_um_filter_47_13]|nr:MAG: uracil-DNA glycosylase [Alphaproteobacteria bacterium CG_4_9_14_3_um_filter_47_13]